MDLDWASGSRISSLFDYDMKGYTGLEYPAQRPIVGICSKVQELPLQMDIIDRKQWFKWQPREHFVLLFILGHAREAREF